uniref:Uncharacterized protein n=1 Tax=Arundo donax TaxID=35708 RepID=A0A0A9F3J3_ARUDO
MLERIPPAYPNQPSWKKLH